MRSKTTAPVSGRAKKAVVLLSGGLDSAVALHLALEKGYACLPLVFDYGQRHRREVESAKKLAGAAGLTCVVERLKFPWKGSSLLDGKKVIPENRAPGIPGTYVPARNTVFMAIALSYAEAVGAKAVFIGAHTGDYSGYPDCRPAFFRAFRDVRDKGTKSGRGIKIMTPLINMNKSEIVKTGARLGVPFGLTWSCYKGGARPCGKCDSCYYRAGGFRDAGLEDPAL
ncbi:MAG: 7-cyano-7-deazaguanine synthase QueC [Candidatus Omnitrophota bacterium]